MAEPVTTDLILEKLINAVETRQVLDAHRWVNAAQQLNTLIGTEHDKLFNLEQFVAQKRLLWIENGDSVAKANARVETMNEYVLMQKQKARIGQIEEMIKIAKLQSRLKDNEMHNYK